MSKILSGQPGIICHIDDILIYGKDQDEHDIRFRAALEAIKNAGLTLNHSLTNVLFPFRSPDQREGNIARPSESHSYC